VSETEDQGWQRLDKWLWCARVMKHRGDCARLVEAGAVRINRQPTDKPHARLRVGDVVTLALRGEVRVLRIGALATRRGPPAEARGLYEEIAEAAPASALPLSCNATESPAYPGTDLRFTGSAR
jgi:ribosome-associated heat shock protein Hsp15